MSESDPKVIKLAQAGNRLLGNDVPEGNSLRSELSSAGNDVFRLAFEGAGNGIAIGDLNGKFVEINQAYCEMLGYTRDELAAMTALDVTHPDDRAETKAAREDLIAGKINPMALTKRLIRKDGGIIWAEITASLARDEEGSPLYVLAHVADISERKKTEDALRASEARFRAVADNAPIEIAIKSAHGEYLFVNDQFCRNYGKDREEVIGKTAADVLPEAFAAQSRNQDESVMMHGAAHVDEEMATFADGEQHTSISVKFPIRMESGRVREIGLIATDITDHNKAQIALRESEARFRRLYNSSPVMMHSIGATGELISVNDYWLDCMGYEREEVIGRKSLEFLSDESRQYAQDVVLPAFMRDGYCTDVPYRFIKKDGGFIDVLLTATAETDNEGNYARSLAVLVDVTERNKAERLLRDSHRQMNAIVDAVPAMISVKDLEHRYVLVNRFQRELIGYGAEPIGDTSDLVSLAHAEKTRELERQVMESGETLPPYDFKILVSEGNEIDFLVTKAPLLGADGEMTGIITVAVDVTEMKDAEFRLRESEQRLKTIIDTVPAIINVKDLESRYVLSNSYHREFFDFPDDGFIGRTSTQVPKDVGKEILAYERKVIETGEATAPYDFKLTNSAGSQRTLRVTKAPLFDLDDQPAGVITSAIDITDLKETETSLRSAQEELETRVEERTRELAEKVRLQELAETARLDSQSRFEAFIDHSPAAILLKDPEGRFLIANRKWQEWFNRNNDEIIGKTVADLFSTEHADEVKRMDQEVLRTGGVVEREIDTPLADGRVLKSLLQKFPVRDSSGQIVALGGINTDITERKRAETELARHAESMDLLRQIAIAANDAQSIEEALQVAIEGVCEFTSWPVGHAHIREGVYSPNLTPTGIWQLADPERFEPFRIGTEGTHLEFGSSMPGRVWESGQPMWIDDVSEDADCPRGDVSRRCGIKAGFAAPVTIGDETVAVLEFFNTKALPVDSDVLAVASQVGTQLGRVVERVRARDSLRAALAAAEKSSQAKSEFMATMSHELRTPLNAILGFADIIEHQYFGELGNERYAEYARNITTGGRHLLELVNDVLDIERIEAGKFEVYPEDLNAADIASECHQIIAQRATETGLKLSLRIGEKLPLVRADNRALKQVLLNVLWNSVKFTPPGGTITTSISVADKGVHFEISDTGIGIPPNVLPHITSAFDRGNIDPYLTQDGVGLGLAITSSLVKLLSGELAIDSRVEEGTTVSITFPAARG